MRKRASTASKGFTFGNAKNARLALMVRGIVAIDRRMTAKGVRLTARNSTTWTPWISCRFSMYQNSATAATLKAGSSITSTSDEHAVAVLARTAT